MTVRLEISGVVPAGTLTAADMPRINLDLPFEIIDGKLEILTAPSFWHQFATREVERIPLCGVVDTPQLPCYAFLNCRPDGPNCLPED